MASPTTALPKVDLAKITIDEDAARSIPPEVAAKYRVVAFGKKGNALQLAVGEPERLRPDVRGALEEFGKRRGMTLELFAAAPADIDKVIGRLKASAKR